MTVLAASPRSPAHDYDVPLPGSYALPVLRPIAAELSRAGESTRVLPMPIARLWHGRTRKEDADAYWRFLHERAIPDYRTVPGNLEVKLLRRVEGDVCHFITFTTWDSLQSIAQLPNPFSSCGDDRRSL